MKERKRNSEVMIGKRTRKRLTKKRGERAKEDEGKKE